MDPLISAAIQLVPETEQTFDILMKCILRCICRAEVQVIAVSGGRIVDLGVDILVGAVFIVA